MQGDGDRVARRVAVAARPPAAYAGHLELDHGRRRAGRHHELTAYAAHLGGHGQRPVVAGRPLQVHVGPQHAGRAGDVHQRAHGGDPGDLPALQQQRPPDPRGDQHGTPVPAVVRRHLADRVEGVLVADDRPGTDPVAGRVRRRLARREGHGQVVGTRPEQAGDVEAVAAVLVGRLPDPLPVQLDRGEGVQAEGDEVDPGGVALGPVEAGLVAPVHPADPGQGRLVLAQVGVGHAAGGHQVQVDAAGHSGRHRPRVEAGGPPAAHRAYGPALVQHRGRHGVSSHFTAPEVKPL